MITKRLSADRGGADNGWLKTHHTFSFADYHDSRHMGFRSLLVINEDTIAPQSGFPLHSHRDMEIVTYVISGELEHKDNIGKGSTIQAGDVQKMSAGTGVVHSEANSSDTTPVHLLQIWILPNKQSVTPSYDQRHTAKTAKHNRLKLIVSSDNQADAIHIQQDAQIFTSLLDAGKSLSYEISSQRSAWVQVISGQLVLNDTPLSNGDGASLTQVQKLTFKAKTNTEFLLFDLA